MKQQYRAFMGQFDAARKEVENMPAYLKESAKMATLTYPSVKAPAEPAMRQSQASKKKG